MVRRALPLALLATLAIGGCGYGTKADVTASQREKRAELIEVAGKYSDHELARLCPGLYPSDFLTNEDKYPKSKNKHTTPRLTSTVRQLVSEAGCDVPSPK